MIINELIATELKIPVSQVAATVALLDDGNTIPFIARYRKEVTGGLDEVQIRDIQTRLGYLRKLVERRGAMKTEIASLLIITKLTQYDYAGAAAIAFVLLLLSFSLLLALNALQGWSTKRLGY